MIHIDVEIGNFGVEDFMLIQWEEIKNKFKNISVISSRKIIGVIN
ncbi:hypothetical protein SAMN05421787_10820 [Virgibacillus pantothenticus]|nr:hypothetical protein SAMN05421787_10820 [Virgibacillus pantothenticus]